MFPPEYMEVNNIKNNVTNSFSDVHRNQSDYVGKTITYNLNGLIGYITKGKGFDTVEDFRTTMMNFVKDVGRENEFQYNGEVFRFYLGKPDGEVENLDKKRKAESEDLTYNPDVNSKGEAFWYVWRVDKHFNELKKDEYFRVVLSVPKGYKEVSINDEDVKIIDQRLFDYTKDTAYIDGRQVILYAFARFGAKGDTASYAAVEEVDGNFLWEALAGGFRMVMSLASKFLGPVSAFMILTSTTDGGFSTFFTVNTLLFMVKSGAFTTAFYASIKSFLMLLGALIAKVKSKDNPSAQANYMLSVQQSFKGTQSYYDRYMFLL